MSHVFHRQLGRSYPIAASAKGLIIRDRDGREYLDASSGAAVCCLGHGHSEVLAAMREQMERLDYAHTSFFSSEPAEALADDLASHAPGSLRHVYFVSGGSEAVEAALKMARQYFVEIGEPQRRCFIARRQSYHGNTLGALAVGGNLWRRQMFAPLLIEGHHVEPCYAYRGQRSEETGEAYGARLAAELEAKIAELGAENVIAFVAETVGGATIGAVPPAPGYFARVRQICDRHGILLILDEVMCGMGRCGSLHACEQEGIAPDLMTIAKGLGGGYQPIGAVLVSDRVRQAIASGSGAFMHGHTYIGHPIACAAGLAVQRILRRDRLIENVAKQGAHLERRLRERFGNHHHVGEVRGRGLFWAIELVADRASKAPFDPTLKLNARIKQEAFARGLLVYPMGGTIDGQMGDHVLIAPPFILDAPAADAIVERLGEAVDGALRQIPA